ncbi:hypothetical protein AB0L13_40860 [Saccharopolyspora shandongensis]|uniref:hypothetical protein n=1 Tax=Saccharopolyspora shandongensis TaxID=418495 RepID=UPI003413C19A
MRHLLRLDAVQRSPPPAGHGAWLTREAVRHAHCTETVDAPEAAAAFVAKRRPVFIGE